MYEHWGSHSYKANEGLRLSWFWHHRCNVVGGHHTVVAQRKTIGQSQNPDGLDFMWRYCANSYGYPYFFWHLRERICLCLVSPMWLSLLRTWIKKKWVIARPYWSSRDSSQVCKGINPVPVSIGYKNICRGKTSFLFLVWFFYFIHKYYIYIIPAPPSIHSNSCVLFTNSQIPKLFFNIIVVKYMCIYTYVYICIYK